MRRGVVQIVVLIDAVPSWTYVKGDLSRTRRKKASGRVMVSTRKRSESESVSITFDGGRGMAFEAGKRVKTNGLRERLKETGDRWVLWVRHKIENSHK